MDRIHKSKSVYKKAMDDPPKLFKLGRIAYLLVISTIGIIIFHMFFSQFYMLSGNGFVSSNSINIALEYDVTIESINFENGDFVKQNSKLFSYDSTEFRKKLIELTSKHASISRDFYEKTAQKKKALVLLKTAQEQYKTLKSIKNNLDTLKKKGFTLNNRISEETKKAFDAHSELLLIKAELEILDKEINSLKKDFLISDIALQDLIEDFNYGIFSSPTDGVIGNFEAKRGSVIKSGTPILEIFQGKKFLLVYFEESITPPKLGDPVIINASNQSYSIGYIVDNSFFAPSVPSEIKDSIFDSGDRLSLSVVMVDQEFIKDIPIMSEVNVFKPIGLRYIFEIFGYSASALTKEYKDIVKLKYNKESFHSKKHLSSMKKLAEILEK